MNDKALSAELRIGDLARELGMGVETIRFYEQRGLVEPTSRRPSGYRVYDARAIERLRFVQRAKALGFTLEEIRELLDLNSELGQSDGPGACAPIKARIQAKRAAVEERIRDLQALLAGLEVLDQACDGSSDLGDCPILQTLRGEACVQGLLSEDGACAHQGGCHD
jgi:MerR family copper efflux transcriptional regulator